MGKESKREGSSEQKKTKMKLILECFWFPATRPSSLLPPQHVFVFAAMKEAKCNVLPYPFPTACRISQHPQCKERTHSTGMMLTLDLCL